MKVPPAIVTVLFSCVMALQCWAIRELFDLKQKVAVIESRTHFLRPGTVTQNQTTNHLAYETLVLLP